MRMCDTSPVPVAGKSTAPRLLKLRVPIPPGASITVYFDCCVFRRILLGRIQLPGRIKKYAVNGTRYNTVYFRRLLLACVQLPGLHKEICQ